MKELFRQLKENTFVSSSLLYIFSSFIIKGISFISTPVFTRLMGTVDYGIVSNFTTWEQVLSTFFCLQVSSGILAAKVGYAANRFDSYMKSITVVALCSALIQSSLIILLRIPIGHFTKISVGIVPLLCISAFGIVMSNICSSYFIAIQAPKKKVFFSIVSCSLTVAISLFFVFISESKSLGRILGFVVAYLFVIIFGFILFLRKKLPSKEIFISDAKYALSFGLPLIPHLLANLINGSADKIFIVNICGEGANGMYSVAYSIGQLALVFSSACADAWNPWYYNESKKKTEESKKEIAKYFRIYSITIGMCFVGVMFLAPELMKMVAPEEYWPATSTIPYVALGVFFLFLYRFPLGYEQYQSVTKYVAPATIIAALINIGLNSLFIPANGINGAALSTTVSYIILWLLHEFVARKILHDYNISLIEYLIPIGMVVLAFILSMVLIQNTFVIRMLILTVFSLTYVSYVFFFATKQ